MSEIRGKEVAQLTIEPGRGLSVSVDTVEASALPSGTYRLYTAGCKGCGKRKADAAAELDAEVATLDRVGASVTVEASPAAMQLPEGRHSLRVAEPTEEQVVAAYDEMRRGFFTVAELQGARCLAARIGVSLPAQPVEALATLAATTRGA